MGRRETGRGETGRGETGRGETGRNGKARNGQKIAEIFHQIHMKIWYTVAGNTKEKRFHMKKLLSILLVFMLVFGMVACGSDETPEGDGTGTENGVVDGSGEEPGSEGGVDGEDGSSEGSAGGAGTVLNPDDLVMGEDGSMEAEYDLKFDAASGFGLDSVVEQVSYRDISSLTTTMEDRLAVADSVFGTTFAAFSEYEEIEEDEIDKLAYAIAMENDDTEATFLEAGAYHSRSTDKHYQYVVMATRNFYEVSDANTAEVVDTLEKAMGISISKKRMKRPSMRPSRRQPKRKTISPCWILTQPRAVATPKPSKFL